MLTANTNDIDAEKSTNVFTIGFFDKIKALLKYAKNATHRQSSTNTEISETTLRDAGISIHEINLVSRKFRFNRELDRLHIQSSLYLPR